MARAAKKSAMDVVQATVLVALLAALVAALGVVPRIDVPGGVPITAQTLGVMLAGLLLGPVRGLLALVVFYVLVALGLPLLSGGRGTIAALLGPSGGYIVGWVAGAFVIGVLAKFWAVRLKRSVSRFIALLIAAIVGGIIVIYAFGIPWLAYSTGVSLGQSAIGALAFVPGDIIKAVIAAVIALFIHNGYRGLLARRDPVSVDS